MGGTVRVNAQLIDAGTGAHLWAEQMDVDQSTLASLQDNFGIANRLARTLSVELVNVEGRRAPRADPDAVDLTMRGWSVLNGGPNKEEVQRSVALFEDALRIDPENSQARVGLAQALTLIYRNRWDPDPAKVLARADEAATRAISTAPNYAHAHYVKAEVLGLSNRFDAALATYDRAIALDRNHAAAYVGRARNLVVIGRAADALAPVEKAIRLSPRDPDLYVWYFVLCHANTHLARDAQAIEWCLKSIATGKTFWFAYVDLASAYAWRGQNAEAAAAVAELLKLRPGYTVQTIGAGRIRRFRQSDLPQGVSSGLSREHVRLGCQKASRSSGYRPRARGTTSSSTVVNDLMRPMNSAPSAWSAFASGDAIARAMAAASSYQSSAIPSISTSVAGMSGRRRSSTMCDCT